MRKQKKRYFYILELIFSFIAVIPAFTLFVSYNSYFYKATAAQLVLSCISLGLVFIFIPFAIYDLRSCKEGGKAFYITNAFSILSSILLVVASVIFLAKGEAVTTILVITSILVMIMSMVVVAISIKMLFTHIMVKKPKRALDSTSAKISLAEVASKEVEKSSSKSVEVKKKVYLILIISLIALLAGSIVDSILLVSSIRKLAYYTDSQGVVYRLENGEYTVLSANVEVEHVVIPSSINGFPVTEISSYSFNEEYELVSIEIPNSVTCIGNYAFYDCTAIETINFNATAMEDLEYNNYAFYNVGQEGIGIEVNIGANVTKIPAYLFCPTTNYYSSHAPKITSVVFAENSECESIGSYAFSDCSSITSVTIPDSVKSVGSSAFAGCSRLTTITLGEVVTSIGSSAFYNCTHLIEINFLGSIDQWAMIEFGYMANPLYYANKLYINDVEVTEVVLTTATKIGAYAFSNCNSITSVTIPHSVISIGSSAFEDCSSLTSVTIGNSVTSIGSSAFEDCSNLTSVTIGESVTSIGEWAFYNCTALTEINFNATAMDDLSSSNYVFAYAGEAGSGIEVNIGANVTKIPAYLFHPYYDSSYAPEITSVVFAENSECESIGSDAFEDCSRLTSVTIPNSVTSIGSSAFSDCNSLTSVTIPNSVTSIGSSAFRNCSSLTSVTIGNSLTSIGDYAFSGCSSLTSVTIGNSLTSIGDGAFYNCSKLTRVNYLGTIDQWAMIEFVDYDANPLYYAEKLYINDVEVTEVVLTTATKIGDYAFSNCNSITSVTIGERVTNVGGAAFYNCSNLTSVTIGNSVTTIGNGAFEGCSSLTSIVFKDTTTWYRTTSYIRWEEKINGTRTSLEDSSTNATYFKSTYYDYYWYKI